MSTFQENSCEIALLVGSLTYELPTTVFAMVFLAKQSGLYNKIVLKDKQEAKDFDENVLQGLLGQTGVTHSTLRPFGVAEIDGKMVDVCSQGDFIDRDKKVQVVQITGKTVIVKVCEA